MSKIIIAFALVISVAIALNNDFLNYKLPGKDYYKLKSHTSHNTSMTPTTEIAPGVFMPMVMLGTWLLNETEAEYSAKLAFSLGYLGIDTAFDYSNTAGIGRAIDASGRSRHQYWITTKIEGGLSFNKTLEEFFS